MTEENMNTRRRKTILTLVSLMTLTVSLPSLLPEQAIAQSGKRIKSSSMEKIPCIRWVDDRVQPKAVLFCVHGLGLHKGVYEELGQTMAPQGIVTYAIDIRGFGSYVQKDPKAQVDFPGALDDIKRALTEIRRLHPSLPVIVLGESMGGAIAIHAAALNPTLIDGVISSVPAGDRFSNVDSGLKIGVHALFGGFDKPIDVGPMVIGRATKKEDLRKRWSSDPLARTKLSPNELIAFQRFMEANFDRAGQIKSCPVLFIQGCKDKLVRPAGTWKLFDSLATPNKNLVLSTSAEHLIFEEGQFSKDDVGFITKWLDKSVINKGAAVADAPDSSEPEKVKQEPEKVALAPAVKVKAEPGKVTPQPTITSDSPAISYWIELYRDGKVYRCNNKLAFKSGDAIRFHVIPQTDGYAYIMMKQSSSGKKALLFPSKLNGENNFLNAGTDYPLPYKEWLTFDNTPGIEKVSLLFSRHKVASETELSPPTHLTAFVSNDMTGAKDLVPTRMQLSWDDPTPVIMPDQIGNNEKLAQNNSAQQSTGSLVKVVFNDPTGMLAVDVALAHQ